MASLGPTATLDGPSCVLLARYLATVTRALERSGRLEAIRPALEAIGRTAKAQRQLERESVNAAVVGGWVSVADAAARAGVSRQAIRKRLARGTLAGERRGRAWRVDVAQPSATP
jgi:hypothetical protein